ncbi:MAG: PGPGW domain-containing protein [Nocardioidaceae bacterium]
MSSQPDRPRGRVYRRLHANPVLGALTKVVVTIVGTLVTIVGIITIVTPGPAVVLIPLGLSILATEWDWAYRLLLYARRKIAKARARELAQDPRVRRRRRLVASAALLVVVGGIAGFLVLFGWPSYAVTGWDWAQGRAKWLPELPGM